MDSDTRVSEIKFGWTAGIIDGEGCITVIGRGNLRDFYPMVAVANTSQEMITELVQLSSKLVGSPGHVNERKFEKYKTQWQWSLFHKTAVAFCKEIEPYLIVKRQQAILIQQFYLPSSGVGRKVTLEERERRRILSNKIRSLNKSRFAETE